jgi:hypothetical protein
LIDRHVEILAEVVGDETAESYRRVPFRVVPMNFDPNSVVRIPDAGEQADARRAHDLIVDNVRVNAGTPGRTLDAVRIVHQANSFDHFDAEELDALAGAASAVGDEGAYWYATVTPLDSPIRVDLAGLAEYARSCEKGPREEDFGALDPRATSALFNFYSDETAIFSPSSSWISVGWEASDISLMAGTREFMAEYVSLRPSAAEDVITWIKFLGKLLTNKTGGEYSGSTLEKFLRRLYGPEVARELWEISLELDNYQRFRLYSNAEREWEKLKRDRPELPARLREIWDQPGR